ncbi:hypothetical protein An10g00720 [Aspergillus niger]|uniref:Uncharacterized protein n=2 Tax=Aspergillus niger TaxID=5061 RepID=A2QV24_ASPNC|nr:hypothetical protein An10g00720 [Aspergillus niger]CAK40511.1 hypothetical protein An10g00720 [Aspergillus niger]
MLSGISSIWSAAIGAGFECKRTYDAYMAVERRGFECHRSVSVPLKISRLTTAHIRAGHTGRSATLNSRMKGVFIDPIYPSNYFISESSTTLLTINHIGGILNYFNHHLILYPYNLHKLLEVTN